MARVETAGRRLSPEQEAFAARVGADPDEAVDSAVEGRVFVYVEQPHRTLRYELDHDGSVLRGDIFSRGTAG
jgi:hypothetical protein